MSDTPPTHIRLAIEQVEQIVATLNTLDHTIFLISPTQMRQELNLLRQRVMHVTRTLTPPERPTYPREQPRQFPTPTETQAGTELPLPPGSVGYGTPAEQAFVGQTKSGEETYDEKDAR